LADQNWVEQTQSYFPALCVANKLWVAPSWEMPEETTLPVLALDPGNAFGTGTHATTQLCLEQLAEYLNLDDVILDYGCGSGILALSAIKLGAKLAFAVDLDPLACQATKDNANKNQIPKTQLAISTPDEFTLPNPVDICVANILSKPLQALAPTLIDSLKPKGILILSGLLERQLEEVLACYQPACQQLRVAHQAGWAAIVLQKI